MGAIGDVFFRALFEDSQLTAEAKRVGTKVGDTAGRTMGQRLSSGLARTLGGAAIGTAVAGGLQSSIVAFGAFEQRMNEVFTLLPGISQKAMGQMQEDVKAFARETGKTTEDVIPALYQAISAGVPQENVFEFLRTANKNAVGGVADLETSVNGLSSVVNAYGSDVLDAATASDIMFTGVRLGKTTIGELSQSLFQVIPTAAALGVSFGDVTASLAAMTAQGVPTSVATTQLRQLFVELSKDGSKAAKTFEDIAGKSFKEFIAAGGNVQDALAIMEKGAASSNKSLSDMFGSVEAGNAALALTGKGAATLTKNLDEMAGSVGATDKAFEQMAQGGAFEAAKFAAKLETLAIDVGQVVSKFGPLPQIIASTFGPSMARAIGAGLGGLVGLVGPRLAAALGGLLPTAVASGTAQGVAMGGAAATSTIATQTAGVATGQAAVAAGAIGPAGAAGTLIGRAMGLAAAAAVVAIPITIAITAAVIGDQVLEGIKNDIEQKTAEAIADGSVNALEAQRKELADRLRSARAGHLSGPLMESLERQMADIEAAINAAAVSDFRRREQGDTGSTLDSHRRREQADMQTAVTTITHNMLAEHRAREQQETLLAGIDDTLTATQHQLHDDLVKATETIRTSNDPKAVGEAIAAVIASILGGAGNAAQTTALVAELSAKRDAALARGDTATAQAFANAIAKIEPLAKGRQWQAEQIAEAKKIVASNKTSAEKIAALKGIQDDLLSHQRTMAADIVAELIDIETGVNKIRIPSPTVISQIIGGGGPTPPKTPPKTPSKPSTIGGLPIGIRAEGGPVTAGSPYWVGERGIPELFVPRASGSIVPAADVPGMAQGNTYNNNVQVQGLIPYEDVMTIPTQLRRLRDFGVLTPRRGTP